MNLQADNLLALGVVAAAAIYLARRGWTVLAGKRRGGCGSCGNCPQNMTADEPHVIGIDALGVTAGKSHS